MNFVAHNRSPDPIYGFVGGKQFYFKPEWKTTLSLSLEEYEKLETALVSAYVFEDLWQWDFFDLVPYFAWKYHESEI